MSAPSTYCIRCAWQNCFGAACQSHDMTKPLQFASSPHSQKFVEPLERLMRLCTLWLVIWSVCWRCICISLLGSSTWSPVFLSPQPRPAHATDIWLPVICPSTGEVYVISTGELHVISRNIILYICQLARRHFNNVTSMKNDLICESHITKKNKISGQLTSCIDPFAAGDSRTATSSSTTALSEGSWDCVKGSSWTTRGSFSHGQSSLSLRLVIFYST